MDKKPANDAAWMRRALDLAARGRGGVAPNPMVGAVVVRDGVCVGEGWHAKCGGPHAEPAALQDCASRGESPQGATMYVTLEPCSHHGRTPPCADALIEAGLKRVVVAMADPFPEVAGRGIARLRDAGIDVLVGVEQQAAEQLNEAYLKRVTRGLPWVICKWAQTLDGKIATATGDSQWISSPASRRVVHEVRARVDAILVGVGTALADNPSLTARDVEVHREALRLVYDPKRAVPDSLQMFQDGGPPVRLLHGDLEDELRKLAAEGITEILVEGGAGMTGELMKRGLADQVLAFVAPKVVGDQAALSAVRGVTCETIAASQKLELRSVERIDDDILLDYRVTRCG